MKRRSPIAHQPSRTANSQPTESPREPQTPTPNYYANLLLLGGLFALGAGLALLLTRLPQRQTSTTLVSREAIERSAPNPAICSEYGSSAIATDLRLFVTLNPFKAYVTRPLIQPGCVLQPKHLTILRKRNLLSKSQMQECEKRQHTFGFVGELEEVNVDITCLYENQDIENLFFEQTQEQNRKSEIDEPEE